MFEIDYRIVQCEYDEFIGQNGFLKIKCNDSWYGDIYSPNIEKYMDKISLDDWFERLYRVIKYLNEKDFVALSDVESFNVWIVFQKKNKKVIVSLMNAEKKQGSSDIEFKLENMTNGKWTNKVVDLEQMIDEIVKKTKEYINYIKTKNNDNSMVKKIILKFDSIL